ncbi:transketolase [Catonella morbi ATCC 51271]|uniref:Transketolase n=1 Tax=Catonella morbi ATCC 51271 TaxID=592026 RepID=V2Y2E7_9FIRM|nr:transketolase [Catonella morbi]ESL03128.1 transketolase [Catonella morbi ATCC 51271]
MSNNIENMSVNAIRVLAADAVQKANSGHPGLPLGAAAIGYELWANHMNHNPKNPYWDNRDRFILSGGHGSTLLYSLLHLFGYGLTLEDMKNFRQWGSKTPGHPEYGVTTGVEASTGPLGAGMAMAVGMAMAETHLAAKFNKEGYPIVDHYTYVLGGDGCMMEGINYEAFSLAGTLKLNKLIVLYDSNKISIEGNTDIAFTEDVPARFKAMGFQVLEVKDGNDLAEIGKAIEEAKANKEQPSFIKINTKIGFSSPKEGSADVHGAPLGADNIIAMKKKLGWPSEEPFFVPEEVYENYKAKAESLAKKEEEWKCLFKEYCEKFPEMKVLWDEFKDENKALNLLDDEDFWSYEDKADATRNLSGKVLNKLSAKLPTLFGGSADLAPSNKSYVNGAGDYSAENYAGRNVHFGVRELAMTGIGNGLVLHGLKAYVSTFFVFSDYVKPMARLASLMEIPLTFVLTHDSIGVGEDGPTHEPIEQLAEFRAMPNFNVFRPADATETIAAWYSAVTSEETPTALVLTRQNLPQLAGSSKKALKGGYVIADSSKETPDAILIASGSEVSLSIEAKEMLAKEGVDVRVVSMPCMDIFEKQSDEYKEKVLPKTVRARVAVEALSEFGWGKYVGLDGKTVCLDRFGASAPADVLFKEFGFTVENVVKAVKEVIK